MPLIELTINGRPVRAQEGDTVLDAATATGIKIPALCHHPALPDIGACRICVVEVGIPQTRMNADGTAETTYATSLQPACTYPVADDIRVETHTAEAIAVRRFVLELLLSDHPLDCMTCDAAGDCALQDLAYELEVKEAPYVGEIHHYAVDDPNPFFERDYSKCIVCQACVRACDCINGVEAIAMLNRGFETKPGTANDGYLEDSPCEFCGMCVEVCPTAALYPKAARGQARAWEMEPVTTTCGYCGVGCQLDLGIKDGRIIQVASTWDAPANHGWTCVKGRFGFDFVHHPDRLTTPLIKKNGRFVEVSWDEALGFVADRLAKIKSQHGGDAIGVLSSAKCTNEENYLLQKLARAVLETNNVDHCARL
jgi:NADH-quinone oxidoreductase subunit G